MSTSDKVASYVNTTFPDYKSGGEVTILEALTMLRSMSTAVLRVNDQIREALSIDSNTPEEAELIRDWVHRANRWKKATHYTASVLRNFVLAYTGGDAQEAAKENEELRAKLERKQEEITNLQNKIKSQKERLVVLESIHQPTTKNPAKMMERSNYWTNLLDIEVGVRLALEHGDKTKLESFLRSNLSAIPPEFFEEWTKDSLSRPGSPLHKLPGGLPRRQKGGRK